jgi:hypothetical protein
MYENLIEDVAVNSAKYLKFIVEDEEDVKKILKQLTGSECYDREHNYPDVVHYYVDGGGHAGDYYPATKTLIFRKSYSLRESSEFNEHFVTSEVERAAYMIRKAEDYPDVKGWAKMDGPKIVEYARGLGEKGLSVTIDKVNGNWELSKGRDFRTLDAGRNASPAKAEKILKQVIKVYG